MIRLSERQRRALFDALEEAGLPEGAEVYLFGSRVDPKAKGGDIDLLVYASGRDPVDVARSIRRAFERRLEERIDVVVLDPQNPEPSAATLAATVQAERIK